MKKVCLLILGVVLLGSFVLAQDSDAPMIDVTAISMGSGTIAEFITNEVGGETTCTLQFEAMENMDESEDVGTSFSCLLEAVVAADLVETLSGEGPFTVFAPTDSAFYALAQNMGASTPDELFADTETLTSILTYHVVADAGSLNDIYFGQDAEAEVFTTLMTVQGSELPIDLPLNASGAEGDEAVVSVGDPADMNQAYVSGTTISVDNGYIIPISEVLVPPAAE